MWRADCCVRVDIGASWRSVVALVSAMRECAPKYGFSTRMRIVFVCPYVSLKGIF